MQSFAMGVFQVARGDWESDSLRGVAFALPAATKTNLQHAACSAKLCNILIGTCSSNYYLCFCGNWQLERREC